MSNIRVVDARMGRGKTSAAVEYMSHASTGEKFLYVTPYLKEVERICDSCDFDQPDSDQRTKLSELKHLMREGRSVASTHALFYLMDDESLELARANRYNLIIDECIETIKRVQITDKDLSLVMSNLAVVEDGGVVRWTDPDYSGKFSKYKEMADAACLYYIESSLLCVMKPDILNVFKDVIMMTYMFDGQYQKAYLDYFGFKYQICGVDDTEGYGFTDAPDAPPSLDYRELIHIIDDPKLNEIGDSKYALSKNWYNKRGGKSDDIKILRNNLNTFFIRRTKSRSGQRLWTTFKDAESKMLGQNGRFSTSFLQLSARASNAYRERDVVAYLVNRFVDPSIGKFFLPKGIAVDEDRFALSEMLQWIWRSAIRDNKPIDLYIPSKRMRDLLTAWINSTYQGEGHERK